MAASVRQHSLLSGSHLQPLAANRVAASGRQWPPAFVFSSAATCSHLQPLEWPPVAASGRPHSLFIGNHLQPPAANRVAASGRQGKWPQVAASGRKWPQVAASGRKWPQVAAFAKIKFVPFCTLSVNVVYQYIIAFLILSWTSDCDARWDTASKLRPEL